MNKIITFTCDCHKGVICKVDKYDKVTDIIGASNPFKSIYKIKIGSSVSGQPTREICNIEELIHAILIT